MPGRPHDTARGAPADSAPGAAATPGTGGVLRRRELVTLWALAAVFALACGLLGRWQWHRFEDKHAKADLVHRNYDAPVVPLGDVLGDARARFDPGQVWRRVEVSGTYDPSRTQLVRNRPWDGGSSTPTFGFEVLVPLRLPDGSALVVDRGWVQDATPPPPPPGVVRVVARLRPSEVERGRGLPTGQVGSIHLPTVAGATGYPVYAAYGGLVSETPAAVTAPAALDPPELEGNEGINASYAVQWVLFALLGLGFPIWFARRRRALADGSPAEPTSDVAVPARRRRIWDTDDEDD